MTRERFLPFSGAFVLAVILILVLTTCKKEEKDNNQGNALQPNVKYLDPSKNGVSGDSAQLSQGIYKVSVSQHPLSISPGDVIVGSLPGGEGFLRKVTGVTQETGFLLLQTVQADMSELFHDTEFSFETGISPLKTSASGSGEGPGLRVNYLAPGMKLSPDGFDFDFSNTVIYQNGGITFKITDGSVHFEPNFFGEVVYTKGILSGLSIYTNKAPLSLICNVNLNASSSATIVNYEKVLADYTRRFIVMVAGIPVYIVAHTRLVATLNTSVDAVLNLNAGIRKNYQLTLGATWDNGQWSGMYELTKNESFQPLTWTGTAHLGEKLVITPQVDFLFYSVAGPYFKPEMWQRFDLGIASPTPDWDASLKAGLDATAGMNVTIFGKTLAACNIPPYQVSETLWEAPSSFEIVSGNGQTGSNGQPLPDPLKVIVKDNRGNALAGVPVHFTVLKGGGSVSNSVVVTNSSGDAETTWTMGNLENLQTVSCEIRKSTGQVIRKEEFYATGGEAYSIEILSGNNQNGILDQWLSDPVKVIVKDYAGNPFRGIYVTFTPNNGGTVHIPNQPTDSAGIAGTQWKLGSSGQSQTMVITAYKSDNITPLQGSPLTFNATALPLGIACPGMESYTDPRNGQVYPTVLIGNQCWFRKNMNLETGSSWCYDSLASNCDIYGRLYDWPTALGVCPPGWHLPGSDEWGILSSLLGGEAGGRKKEAGTAHWQWPNTGATNETGFTSLPGGAYLPYQSSSTGLGVMAYFWSSTIGTAFAAYVLYNRSDNAGEGQGMELKTNGHSVRCVRDQDK